jgi:hypothetical protein
MNVPKRLIGRVISLQWADPNNARGPIETLKKGRASLATWTEYGVLHDVTDGVVMIAHSYAAEPGATAPDEIQRTAVPEVLIEKLTVFQEELTT